VSLRGTGTQRLEDQIRRLFPAARVARMDTDTMRSRGSHEKTLDAFREGRLDILVGTQMIAKGLDFPSVVLVGVVNADAALHLADFRASERTCQLVMQVAGRSGRGALGGRVVVQTSSPDHPAFRAASAHDYEAFVRSELPIREALGYPPFGQIVRVVVRSVDDAAARHWAGQIAERLRAAAQAAAAVPASAGGAADDPASACGAADDPASAGGAATVRVLGPAPAPIARLRDRFRWHVQVLGPDGPQLRGIVRAATDGLVTPDDVAWIVDVDPVDML